MNDNQNPDNNNVPGRHSVMPYKSYTFLLRLSRKLGTVATKSFVDMRQFLNHEITVSPTDRFRATMPRLHRGEEGIGRSGAVAEAGREATKEKKKKSEAEDTPVDPTENLKKIVKQSHEVLASANTVFPITLFPDTVVVDRTKVTITRRNFFWSSDVMSIRIEDVLNVSASVGPLFGSLTVASRVMSTIDHFQINYFWRNDAIHLKHIIQGYVIAQHNNLDTAHLNKNELVKTLKELGHDSTN
jgi:hypothetical protein